MSIGTFFFGLAVWFLVSCVATPLIALFFGEFSSPSER